MTEYLAHLPATTSITGGDMDSAHSMKILFEKWSLRCKLLFENKYPTFLYNEKVKYKFIGIVNNIGTLHHIFEMNRSVRVQALVGNVTVKHRHTPRSIVDTLQIG